jgi:hypothetical protein
VIRLRIHDDGRAAFFADSGSSDPWLVHPLWMPGPVGVRGWLTDEEVHGPGWHDALVLPCDDTGARRLAGTWSGQEWRGNNTDIARAVLDRLAGREPAPEVRSEDCIREAIRADGQPVHEGDRGVRVTHRPSGITVESISERSQLQNTAAAIRELQTRLAEGGER